MQNAKKEIHREWLNDHDGKHTDGETFHKHALPLLDQRLFAPVLNPATIHIQYA